MSVRFTESSLAKVGVEIRCSWHQILGCVQCGQGWSPNQPPAGQRMHRGWWKCPNGCNEEAHKRTTVSA